MVEGEYPVPHWERDNQHEMASQTNSVVISVEWRITSHCFKHVFTFSSVLPTLLCGVVDWLMSLNEDIAHAFGYQNPCCVFVGTEAVVLCH